MDIRTRCARGTGPLTECGSPLAPPIVTASTFAFEDHAAIDDYYAKGGTYLYSRYENPTVRATERLYASLEGAEDALLFSSGMAAISTTLLALVKSGERIAAQREIYGGSSHLLRDVLPSLGIETVWLPAERLHALLPEDLRGARLLYLETPTNPGLSVVSLRRASALAHAAGALAVVDATFATPALLEPLALGCDVVVHSATKYLGGHSDLTAGACAASAELIHKIAMRRRALGGIADSFTAFLLQRGLRTLAVRMEAHSRGAEHVALGLVSHPSVGRVLWPGLESHPDHETAKSEMRGFPGVVTLELRGGAAAAERLHDSLTLFVRAPSLGGVESLVSIPARMSHRFLTPDEKVSAGVTPGMVRLSVGLESPADLLEDLRKALDDIE